MSFVINNMYDALKLCESTDVSDNVYDNCICWDLQDDEDSIESKCCTEIQKRTDIIRYAPPYNTIADIAGFVKQHMDILYVISQKHRLPMPDANPENDESMYCGVTLVNQMMQGYASNDEYEKLYNHLVG